MHILSLNLRLFLINHFDFISLYISVHASLMEDFLTFPGTLFRTSVTALFGWSIQFVSRCVYGSKNQTNMYLIGGGGGGGGGISLPLT